MRRRILAAIVATAALALVLFGIPLAVTLQRAEVAKATIRLERDASVAAGLVTTDFNTTNDEVELPSFPNTQVALYRLDGRLVAGQGPPLAGSSFELARRNHIVSTRSTDSLIVTLPISSGEQVIGFVRAERAMTSTTNAFRRRIFSLGSIGLLALVLAALAGHLLTNRITRHVRTVQQLALNIGDGLLPTNPTPTGIRELDDVMATLRTTNDRLAGTLERQRTFSADASHQLRTPLTGLRLILDSEVASPRQDPNEALHEALSVVDRLEATINTLLALTHTPAPSGEPVDLDEIIAEAIERFHGIFAANSRPLRSNRTATQQPIVRRGALKEALNVLIENALHHGRGTVSIDTKDIEGGVSITVTDEGPGISDAIDPGSIFRCEPNGELRNGMGIGLPLARSLIETEGGRVILEQALPSAIFAIALPTSVKVS